MKVFLIWIYGSPFVQRSTTICAILVEGILRNNPVKLVWVGGSGADVVYKIFFIWSSGGPPVWCSGTIYEVLKEGIMGNIHVKLCEI